MRVKIYFLMVLVLLSCKSETGIIGKYNDRPIEKKIAKYSSFFKGSIYKGDPLGEGSKALYDSDPLFSFNEFDCLTYIETVTALSLSKDEDSFRKIIKKIRYENGNVSFISRNHFMSADWIPNNTKEGFIQDITEDIASVKVATALIEKSNWYSKMKEYRFTVSKNKSELFAKLKEETKDIKDEKVSINYIPLEIIFGDPSLIKQIPSGAIINIVRSWDLEESISHTGFVFQKDSVTILRHASYVDKKVVDVNLLKYLLKYKESKTVKGINILRIKDNRKK